MPLSYAAISAFLFEVFRLSVWLVLLAAIFIPLERVFALRPQRLLREAVWSDLGLYFASGLLPGFVLSLPMALVATGAQWIVPAPFQEAVASCPLWLRLSLGLIVGELGAYWAHRWSHEIPILWRFHALHHEAEQMDWLVNTRTHPLDIVFSRLCTLTPLYMLGLGATADMSGNVVPMLVIIISVAWGFFVHANVWWRFGALEQVIATPAFHHWHHTLDEPINRNFAAMLPWLDRVFGTLHLPRRDWPGRYGVATPPGEILSRCETSLADGDQTFPKSQ